MNVVDDLGREASLRAMWRALYAASCCVEPESEIGGVTNVAQWFDYAPYGSVIATTNTGQTVAARGYIGQFSDQSGLSYLNARYYNASQGQFITQDPVFWGDSKGQALGNPQSLNSYSYANDNPIINKDPSGKCFEDGCVLEASLAIAGGTAGFVGTYAGDVLRNRSEGKTGLDAYAIRSSPREYATAIGTGAIAAPLAAYSLAAAAVTSAGGYAYQNYLGGKPFSLRNTLLVGGLSFLGGAFFQWGTGPLANEIFPLSMSVRQGVVGAMFDMNSQVILQTALNNSNNSQSLPATGSQGGTTYYRNSSGLLSLTPQATVPGAGGGGSSGGSYTQTLPGNYHTACGTLCK